MTSQKRPIIDVKKAVRSFQYAFNGLWLLITKENNFRIHILAAVVVITMGFYFSIKKMEWLFLILFVGLVMAAEAFNTVVEALVDWQSMDRSPRAKRIKDIAAGAVLICAIASLVGGILIFYSYFSEMF